MCEYIKEIANHNINADVTSKCHSLSVVTNTSVQLNIFNASNG